MRRFLPQLIDLVWSGKINPGKVFDLTLPLDQVAEGYRAIDERRGPSRPCCAPDGGSGFELNRTVVGRGARPIGANNAD